MYVLNHPNGSTLNKIITEKLREKLEDGAKVAPEVQGAELGGQFSYDKAHVASLSTKDPNLKQDVVVLHAESPCNIFVCPENQIGLAENIAIQVKKYTDIDPGAVGHGPSLGKVCLAKSTEDDQWYRGVCIGFEDDKFQIFFADFGFKVSNSLTFNCFPFSKFEIVFHRKLFLEPT